MRPTILCPECVAGKHGNCDGTAWNVEEDQPAPCDCEDLWHDRAEEATMRRLTGWQS